MYIQVALKETCINSDIVQHKKDRNYTILKTTKCEIEQKDGELDWKTPILPTQDKTRKIPDALI